MKRKKLTNDRVAAFTNDPANKQTPVVRTGTTTAPTSNHSRRKPRHPEDKIHDFVDKHFGTFIYKETLEFAAENLCEAGVEPADLFDANTGAVTEKGLEIISEAVEDAWDRYLDLCKDTYNEPVFRLPELLSDRTVLDFLMAKAAAQPWMERARAEHRKAATVSVEETDQEAPAPRPGLLASEPTDDLQSQFWLAKGVVRYPDPEGGASWADHSSYHVIEAGSAEQASEKVMQEFCPEAYEDGGGDDARGEWGVMHDAQDGPEVRAFYLGETSAAVDVGCGFAVLWAKPVTAVEYGVLKKWLSK